VLVVIHIEKYQQLRIHINANETFNLVTKLEYQESSSPMITEQFSKQAVENLKRTTLSTLARFTCICFQIKHCQQINPHRNYIFECLSL
jgi:hypothetical protein